MVVGVKFLRQGVSRSPDVPNAVRESCHRQMVAPLPRNMTPRILLLQGPVGPFFGRLRRFLNAAGIETWQVVFNAGDRLFAGFGGRTLVYSKGLEKWEDWLAQQVIEGQFNQIVLFGSERPVHAIARKVAASLNLPVISLEEGYIRPGAITLERGANNSLSPIAGKLPPPGFSADSLERPQQSKSSFLPICLFGATYYTVAVVFSRRRQREMLHRPIRLVADAVSWVQNFFRRLTTQLSNVAVVERLLEHHVGQYFVVPLQVSDDTQLKAAALGWNNARLIRESIQSFALTAPRHMRLVFKIHPLECERNEYRRLVRQLAKEFGVEDRVDLIEFGSIGHLTRHSAGMITINSTSGLSAIHHGVPLLVIGNALYANPELATCARGEPDFSAFWKGAHVADAALRKRYLAWVWHECLRPGDFYTREGIDLACAAVADAITSHFVSSEGLSEAA